eukprot:170170-Prorocentrum_minimum.AAC.1
MREALNKLGRQLLAQQERLASAREEELARGGKGALAQPLDQPPLPTVGSWAGFPSVTSAEAAGGAAGHGKAEEERHVQLRAELRKLERECAQAGKRLTALAAEEWAVGAEAAKRREEADLCRSELESMEGAVAEVKTKWEAARKLLHSDLAALGDRKAAAEQELWELRMDCAEALDDFERRLRLAGNPGVRTKATESPPGSPPPAERERTPPRSGGGGRRARAVAGKQREAERRAAPTSRSSETEGAWRGAVLAEAKEGLDHTLQAAREELRVVQASVKSQLCRSREPGGGQASVRGAVRQGEEGAAGGGGGEANEKGAGQGQRAR